MIQIKRAYEKAGSSDGYRVLVDRLWPRGVSKVKAKINLWLKDIGPSNELRKWFGHDPKKWTKFKKKYKAELKKDKTLVAELRKIAREHKKLTLVYAAKDSEHNNAVVLKEYLK